MSIFSRIKEKAKGVLGGIKDKAKKVFEKVKKRVIGTSLPKLPPGFRDELAITNEAYVDADSRKPTIMGWRYDRALSAKRHAVYVKQGSREVMLGLRGTVPNLKNIRDLGSDALIGAEDTLRISPDAFKKSEYMKEARQAYKEVQRKYSGFDITIVGHSLGGRGALQLAKDKKDEAVIFNAGGGRIGNKNQLPAGSVHFRAPTDPISVGFRSDKRTFSIVDESKPKGVNHSLEYFM